MRYDFDKVIPRYGTESYKWDAMDYFFPECPQALPMWVADMDFVCPDEIVNAIKVRATHPVYGYAYADDSLKVLTAEWQWKQNQWRISSENITLSSGIVPAICAAIRAYTEIGDGIIIQTPVYYPFMESIESNYRTAVENPLIYDGERWVMDIEGFSKAAAMPSTKLFILCNPHNPVGRVFTQKELCAVGEICVKNDVMIVSDEIHSDLIFLENRHIPIASLSKEMANATLTAFSPSKTFNISGLQASVIIAENPDILRKFEEEMARNYFIMSVFGVTALRAAYGGGCEEYLKELLVYLWDNYLFVDRFLKEHMPRIKCQKPEATYLLWLDCSELGLSGENLKEFFLKEAKVAFDYGKWFSMATDQYMRMNIGCPRATLEAGLRRIKSAYDQHSF